jgi:hypothetical protein
MSEVDHPVTPRLSRKNTKSTVFSENEEDISERDREIPKPAYGSPSFDDVEQEFKDQLLSFATDVLLNDVDLLKNITERGNKILLHITQLKKLIAILYLSKEDRPKWDQLVTIETEKIITNNCLCKSCTNPFYEKVKHIFVNNSVNFLTTPFAVNMTSTFRISLEYVLTENSV